MTTSTRPSGTELRSRWEALRASSPRLHARDAAAQLGVSEAELVASGVGAGTRRLNPDWTELLTGLEAVGQVTTLVRNESCVHEKTGRWHEVQVTPHHALVLGEDIDLRLFPRGWAHAFAVVAESAHGTRRSFQVFDRSGTAVLKVFVAEGGDVAAFEALASRLATPGASPELEVAPVPPVEAERPDADIDVAGFRQGWRGLQDTHDFFPLLRRFGVGRAQAMRLAEPEFAWPAAPSAFRAALEQASKDELPIMIFVGNPGAIQIHTGPVSRLKDVEPWFNVLDPAFNLHLREAEIASAWAVRKPTVDGIVSSLELFDAAGNVILQMFGKRKPGIPERPEWRALLERVAPPPGPGVTAPGR